MADADKRLTSLEDELKLLKGEVKRTLVDLRAFIMREDSPLTERSNLQRGGSMYGGDQPAVPVVHVDATNHTAETDQKVEALQEELKALRIEKAEAAAAPEADPVAPPTQSDGPVPGYVTSTVPAAPAQPSAAGPSDDTPGPQPPPEDKHVEAMQDELMSLKRRLESMPDPQVSGEASRAKTPSDGPAYGSPHSQPPGPYTDQGAQAMPDYTQANGHSRADGTSIDAVMRAVYSERADLRGLASPGGTVTLLFANMDGSAGMKERLGHRSWMMLLRTYSGMIRHQVEAHQGFEVKSMGDGFLMVFPSARQAVRCAIGVQRAFASYNSQKPEEPIYVRTGLHTGEAGHEQDDTFSRAVGMAARISSQAQGGQIMVSPIVKDLAGRNGEFSFNSGREIELPGSPGRHWVFNVKWQEAGEHPSNGARNRERQEHPVETHGENGHYDGVIGSRYSYHDGDGYRWKMEQMVEDDWAPSHQNGHSPSAEVAVKPDFLNVNLMASLVRWVFLARRRLGQERLMDCVGLYLRSAYSDELREMIIYICGIAEEEPPNEPEEDPAQECIDLIHQLHGILAGGVIIANVPRVRSVDETGGLV